MTKYSIAILIWSTCKLTALNAQVLPADSLALVELFQQTNGTSWKTKTNWLKPGQPVSTWYGVARTGARVSSIILTDNNITGTLPSSIGNLTGLVQLALGKNKLSGSIPVEIGNLSIIKFLFLGDNQLTGSVPSSIGNLSTLETLQLNDNQLAGVIPTEIGNCPSLKNLLLRDNNVTGIIPSTIGNLSNLQVLQLDSCQLTGSIPDAIGNLVKLRELYLEKNQLTGSIPITIGNLILLQRLWMNQNQLSGDIPETITNLVSLQYLDLQDNELSGDIPQQIGNLVNLTDLYLGNEGTGTTKNKLTGSIPASIGNLSLLENFKIKDDSLSGQVPVEFTFLSNVKSIDLNNNAFDYLPEFLAASSSISFFDIRNNYFTFEDIYRNRNISGLVFEPQKTTQVQDSVTEKAMVGSVYNITINDNTDGNSYAWSFKNSLTGKDSVMNINSPTLVVNPVNENSMGTYSCVITNATLSPTFSLVYKHTITAIANLSGVIFLDTDQPAQSGNVQLFEITTNGAFLKNYPDATINSNGQYSFTDVVLSNYLVKAEANDNDAPRVATWYTEAIEDQAIFWEEADTLFFRDTEVAIDMIAYVKPPNPQPGPGKVGLITGTFYEVIPDEEGKTSARTRVKGAAVAIRRVDEGGKGSAVEVIDYTLTDDNGEFMFEYLEEAEYKLNIQYPGYLMDETSFIYIPIGSSLYDRHVAVEAEILNNKIFVTKLIVTGWENEQHALVAYPNPTLQSLFLEMKESQPVQLHLYNANGKVEQVEMHWNGELNRCEVDVRSLSKGQYILHVKGINVNEYLRIVIQ